MNELMEKISANNPRKNYQQCLMNHDLHDRYQHMLYVYVTFDEEKLVL